MLPQHDAINLPVNDQALYTTYPTFIQHKHQTEQEKESLNFRPNIRQVNML